MYIAFDVGQSFIERNGLAAGSKLRELCLDDAVRKVVDIVEACSKHTDTSSDWRKIGSMEPAQKIGLSPGSRPRRLVVSVFDEKA